MQLPVKRAGIFIALVGAGIIGAVSMPRGSSGEYRELLREKVYRQDEIRDESHALFVAKDLRYYWKGNVLYRSPIRGGKVETVYVSKRSWEGQEPANASNAILTDNELLLIDEEPLPATDSTGGMYLLKGPASEDIYIRNDPFLADPSAEPTTQSERRTIPRHLHKARSAPVLVRIRLDADKPRATVSSLSFDGYRLDSLTHLLTPKGVYWVRPGSTEVVAVWSKSQDGSPFVDSYVELKPQDTLMYLPFGEKSRVVRERCVIRTLTRLPDAILVFEATQYQKTPPIPLRIGYDEPETPRPFGTAKRSIPRSADGKIDDTSFRQSFHREVVFNGRYYWAEGPTRVMSSARDGSDIQLVSELHHENGDITGIESLFADQEHFWVHYRVKDKDPKAMPVVATPSSNQQSGAAMRAMDAMGEEISAPATSFVSLLNVNKSPHTLGEPLRLPNSPSTYRAGYLYFDTADMEKAVFDAFSDKSTEHWVYRRWRLRLPVK